MPCPNPLQKAVARQSLSSTQGWPSNFCLAVKDRSPTRPGGYGAASTVARNGSRVRSVDRICMLQSRGCFYDFGVVNTMGREVQ